MGTERVFSKPSLEGEGLERQPGLEIIQGDTGPPSFHFEPRNVRVSVSEITTGSDGMVMSMNIAVRWDTPIEDENIDGFDITYPGQATLLHTTPNVRSSAFTVPPDITHIEVRTTFTDRRASRYVRVLRENFTAQPGSGIDERPQNVQVTETPRDGGGFNYEVTWETPTFTLHTIDYSEISISSGLFFEASSPHRYGTTGATDNIRVRSHFTNLEVSEAIRIARYDYNPDNRPIGLYVVYQRDQGDTPVWRVFWLKPRGFEPTSYQTNVNGTAYSSAITNVKHHDFAIGGINNHILVRANYPNNINSPDVRLDESDWTRLLARHVKVNSRGPRAERWRITIDSPLGISPTGFEWRHVDNQEWREVSNPTNNQQNFLSTEDGDEWIEVRGVYNLTLVGVNITYHSNVIRVNFADWTNNRN